jgi:hypothetical protein
MNQTITRDSVLEAARAIDALIAASNLPADSVLRLRAISAAEDLRGQLLATVPATLDLRAA